MSGISRVYIGNLPPGISERDLEEEFGRFGRVRNLWVARKPPGFAFLEYEDARDAEDAIKKLDGYKGWRVELSRRGPKGGPPVTGGGYSGPDRGRSPPARRRSPSPARRRRSPSYEAPRRRSPSYDRERKRSVSRSPVRRSRSRSPARRDSPVRRRSPSPRA